MVGKKSSMQEVVVDEAGEEDGGVIEQAGEASLWRLLELKLGWLPWSLVTGVFEAAVLRLSKEGRGVVVVDFSSFPDGASSAVIEDVKRSTVSD